MKLFSDVLLDIFLKELDKKYKELSLSVEDDFHHSIVINFLEKAYTLYNILKVNESLDMKIDELTSLDNIKEISEKYGLKYHSENIKTIE